MPTSFTRLRMIVACLTGSMTVASCCAAAVTAQEGERHVILVDVIDEAGHNVPGLSAANFRGEYRGQPVRVAAAVADRAARRIAVILDRSESQRQAGSRAVRSAQTLIETLTPYHQLVIGSVADSTRQRSELTNDRVLLEQSLGDIAASEPTGLTALYSAILGACQGLRGKVFGDVVMVFSDGDDTASGFDPDEIVTAATQMGV
jgi:hypothetical protein